jgi:hypothetical protein
LAGTIRAKSWRHSRGHCPVDVEPSMAELALGLHYSAVREEKPSQKTALRLQAKARTMHHEAQSVMAQRTKQAQEWLLARMSRQ